MKKLYLDLETSPNIAHVWGLFDQTVSLSQLRESTRVICFAAKWAGSKRTLFFSEFADGREAMIKAAHELLAEADVVVHYNGKRFDIPHLNREFVEAGLAPPAPYAQTDLFSTVKQRFRFPSNKLQYVAGALGVGSKVQHSGHDLWVRCMAGDPVAWREMRKYNIQDVILLEVLEARIQPWILGAPNAQLFSPDADCPSCGGNNLRREGYAYTAGGQYQRHQCRDCGTWSRATRRMDGADKRTVA